MIKFAITLGLCFTGMGLSFLGIVFSGIIPLAFADCDEDKVKYGVRLICFSLVFLASIIYIISLSFRKGGLI